MPRTCGARRGWRSTPSCCTAAASACGRQVGPAHEQRKVSAHDACASNRSQRVPAHCHCTERRLPPRVPPLRPPRQAGGMRSCSLYDAAYMVLARSAGRADTCAAQRKQQHCSQGGRMGGRPVLQPVRPRGRPLQALELGFLSSSRLPWSPPWLCWSLAFYVLLGLIHCLAAQGARLPLLLPRWLLPVHGQGIPFEELRLQEEKRRRKGGESGDKANLYCSCTSVQQIQMLIGPPSSP